MKPNGIQSQTVLVDGQQIHYYEAGQAGSALVLLHGGGVDSALISWGEILPGLSAQHRVIAPDLPGYGQSDKPQVEYSMVYYLNFLHRFLEALQLEKVSLAGLSLGGGIALGFTLDFPERVEKLVLVDSYGIMSSLPYHKLTYFYVHTPLNEFSYWVLKRDRKLVRQSLTAGIYDPNNITDELLAEVLRAVRDPSAGRAFMSFQRSEYLWNGLRTDDTRRLGEIHTPTLILHGDHDETVPVQWAQRAHAAIQNSRFVLLKNRKHWALRDRPEEIVTILLEFLDASKQDGGGLETT
jgi:pimeloyl-ACP methyl ester carboxylesterase